MRRTRSTRSSAVDRAAGFSLVEILVTVAILAGAVAAAVVFLLTTTGLRREGEMRIETQQGLRAVLDTLARDVRLAGACLPRSGDLLPFDATNAGTRDEVTVRIGLVDTNLACIWSTIDQTVAAGANTIVLETVQGFEADMRVYVIHPNNSGETLTIRSVDAGTRTLTLGSGLSQAYPATAGVFALTERRYRIDAGVSSSPTFVVETDGGASRPMAPAIDALNFQYRLARNCPACDVVDAPGSTEWPLVTDIFVSATASTPGVLLKGETYSLSDSLRIKPRNLLP